MYHTAIVLAAGRGSRMKSDIQKQFLNLAGRPLIYYSLQAFEESFVDEIILVTGESDISYCKEEIVERYGLRKVKRIVAGGKERYHSVYNGLLAARPEGFVYIHDGARPFLTKELLERAKENLQTHGACVAAVPAKDTVKLADSDGYVTGTPDRRSVWNVQTPQCFSYALARKAYDRLMQDEDGLRAQGVLITDDAMVVEYFGGERVRLFAGSYYNMKITTPEDLDVAECYQKKLGKR